mmetsp:Transcript_88088/g.234209  ORF Transcript_88088/g.234209 Transcript_88088/m.234209 type:complete len:457 (+) Transcript_88088:4897-6267(+)
MIKWHNGEERYGCRWRCGDVIGFACDLVEGEILISVNGNWNHPNGQLFKIPTTIQGLFPSITGKFNEAKLNFGRDRFRYRAPNDTYAPFEKFVFKQEFVPQYILHHSAARGNADAVQFLIQAKADVNEKDQLMRSAMQTCSNRECKSLLMKAGADGHTHLMFSAFCGEVKSVQTLLDENALVDGLNDQRQTALHLAASDGNYEIMQLLLKANANPNATDLDGKTPLNCVSRGKKRCQTLLLQHGARPPLIQLHRGYPAAVEVSEADQKVVFKEFASVRCLISCPKGKRAYYELELLRPGVAFQWGFCVQDWAPCPRYVGLGVGDDEGSWGVDGHRKLKWHDGHWPFGSQWQPGDVIGLACDLVDNRFLVSVNGNWSEPNGLAFELSDDVSGLHPAFTCQKGACKYTLDAPSFRHLPPSPEFVAFEDLRGEMQVQINVEDDSDKEEETALTRGDKVW